MPTYFEAADCARPNVVIPRSVSSLLVSLYGNCWFAGALSCCTLKPGLIENIFLTKSHNKHGAYLLRLCHAGEWRAILLDDLFPCSKPWEGRIAGDSIYFARGGELSYLQSRRRQLWVPLIEKAAAKLYGCYGALNSGTFSEALGLFTGAPVETMGLYVRAHVRRARQQERDKRTAQKTMNLLQGRDPDHNLPQLNEEEELILDSPEYEADLLWTRFLSFFEAGYVMGLACAAEAVEKSRDEVTSRGLQSPHAYGVMEVRELQDLSTGGGKTERLVKVRNPWGERAPQTWNGRFGRDWTGWTFPMKLELGVVNHQNVKMHEDSGIFWMPFEDVREYFAQVEVCRVKPAYWGRWCSKVWLTSSTGGVGEIVEFATFQRTEIDVSLWQERHVKREAAINAKSTSLDVGLGVFRWRRKTDSNFNKESSSNTAVYSLANGDYLECIGRAKRTRDDHTSLNMTLEGGYRYIIIPFSMSLLRVDGEFPRAANLVMHHNHKIGFGSDLTSNTGNSSKDCVKTKSSWPLLHNALWAMLDKEVPSKQKISLVPLEVLAATMSLNSNQNSAQTDAAAPYNDFKQVFMRDGDAGYLIGIENHSDSRTCGVQYDMSESHGFLSSRCSAVCFDVVPPKSRLLIAVATVDYTGLNSGEKREVPVGFRIGCQYVDPEMAVAMGLTPREDFHEDTVELSMSGEFNQRGDPNAKFLGPDADLTGKAEEDNVFCGHKVEKPGPTVAVADSKKVEPATNITDDSSKDENSDETDLLEQALKLSVDPKVSFEARVKAHFARLVTEQKMSPNEAAVEAVRLAKAEG